MLKRVRDKINSLNLRYPVFLPVWTSSCPIWKHNAVLIGFEGVPRSVNAWKDDNPWNQEKTLMIMESGGLQIAHGTVSNIASPFDCMKWQMRAYPDLAFTLDYPVKVLKTSDPTKRNTFSSLGNEAKKRRVDETISSAKQSMQFRDMFVSEYEHEWEPMAVIQGYDLPSIIYCTEELYSLGYEFYAMGSLTIESTARNTWVNILNDLTNIRDVIGKKSWMHLLGLTDVRLLCPLKGWYESFDSAKVTLSAKNGILLREDGSSCFIGKDVSKHDSTSLKNLNFSKEEKELIEFIELKNVDPLNLQVTNTAWYHRLQELSLSNFLKQLEAVLWRGKSGKHEEFN